VKLECEKLGNSVIESIVVNLYEYLRCYSGMHEKMRHCLWNFTFLGVNSIQDFFGQCVSHMKLVATQTFSSNK